MMNSTPQVTSSISDVLKLLYAKAAISQVTKQSDYKDFNEPYLVAGDEQFLGVISKDKEMPESIFNEFGIYGSKYSDVSIFNEEGTYGSEDSIYSPFNELAQYPPKIYYKSEVVGYLTKNDHMPDNIDPEELFKDIESSEIINWDDFLHDHLS